MDEEAILGGLRSGEDLPDYNFEEFEAGSAGQDRRSDDPDRDTPRSIVECDCSHLEGRVHVR